MKHSFLPITKEDLAERGIDRPDFLYVIGDAYVDHPSFGPAVISRVLEAEGFTVAILPQPDFRSTEDFLSLGRPKLGVLVSAGNIDSMVAHYTAAKKPRSTDAYTEGGKAGKRPDRATIVYCNRIREAFGDIPLIIGGLEASLRRFAHYDYWDNRVRRSILFDSRADLLLYGMGERQIVELAKALAEGRKIREITEIDGSAYVTKERPQEGFEIPDFETVREDKKAYALSCRYQFTKRERMLQRHMDRWLVVNPPMKPLSTKELDRVYSLPYQRAPHPSYTEGVPGITEVKFSIASSRGCFGGCNFCSLAFHQGRYVTARSEKSILAEAERLTKDPDFKGYIHDVGGPTANFRRSSCHKEEPCAGKQCLFPGPCKNLIVDHKEYLHLLRQMRKIPGIKKVFIRSGIRYDYLIYDKDDTFFRELCEHHVSGQLKVAPEHISPHVLSKMGKPPVEVYNRFAEKFYKINEELGKKQFLVPYLISSHPGSRLEDAIRLAEYLKEHHIHPEQVQDFYPTPGTVSTCMYHTGLDPMTMKPVFVPKTPEEKAMQRALLQWSRPENDTLVRKALRLAGREDLIGFGPKCLIRPKRTDGVQKKTTNPPKGGNRGQSIARPDRHKGGKIHGKDTKRKRGFRTH